RQHTYHRHLHSFPTRRSSDLNFTEELTWEVRNQPVRGLPWPYNETRTRSVTSFTQFQAILSSHHLLDINVNAFPLRRRFADINADRKSTRLNSSHLVISYAVF